MPKAPQPEEPKIIQRPKCSVLVHVIGGAWALERSGQCKDLVGTNWGNDGEYEWCPTRSDEMPDGIELLELGNRQRVMAEIERVRAAKRGKNERKR
jgi:hypothetical protein